MFCPSCHADYPADWKTCPKDSTSLLSSPKIGKYTIDGMLGVGGMGAVYRATNPDTGAAVAVKVMNREVAAAQDARERFKREAGTRVGPVTGRMHRAESFIDFESDTATRADPLPEGRIWCGNRGRMTFSADPKRPGNYTMRGTWQLVGCDDTLGVVFYAKAPVEQVPAATKQDEGRSSPTP